MAIFSFPDSAACCTTFANCPLDDTGVPSYEATTSPARIPKLSAWDPPSTNSTFNTLFILFSSVTNAAAGKAALQWLQALLAGDKRWQLQWSP
jgi:hypothetical protein